MAHVADVVIQSASVTANLSEYVVYIDLADMTADFWSTVTASGGDIRCYKSGGSTALPREVVAIDTSGETGELYVRFNGTLSSSSNTTIEIHADGSSSEPSASSTYGKNKVWADGGSYDYLAVYHLEDLTDSTGNGWTLTASGSPTAGAAIFGDGYSYDDDEYHTSGTGTITFTTLSIQIAAKDINSDFNRALASIGDSSTAGDNIGFGPRGTTNVNGAAYVDDSKRVNTSNATYAAGAEIWGTLVFDGTDDFDVYTYYNGSSLTNGSGTYTPSGTGWDRFGVACLADSSVRPATINNMDEVRFAKFTISEDRHDTEYNNYFDTSNFYTVNTVSSDGAGLPVGVTTTPVVNAIQAGDAAGKGLPSGVTTTPTVGEISGTDTDGDGLPEGVTTTPTVGAITGQDESGDGLPSVVTTTATVGTITAGDQAGDGTPESVTTTPTVGNITAGDAAGQGLPASVITAVSVGKIDAGGEVELSGRFRLGRLSKLGRIGQIG